MKIVSRNYFDPAETQCKCGCGFDIRPELRVKLNEIRHSLGFPLFVHSGARCPAHNHAVGGAKASFHLKGLAADIRWPVSGIGKRNFIGHFDGFDGIGLYPSFVHLDLRTLAHLKPTAWVNYV